MILDDDSLSLLAEVCRHLQSGFDHLPCENPPSQGDLLPVLQKTAERLWDNFPYQHPLYAGQMLKPPHPVAHLAYTLAMCLNPNNHAHDGGRASSRMERECVAQLAQMIGWKDEFLGHLCSGGTVANLEALWVARELTDGRPVLASSQAHYTHGRLSGVLAIPFLEVPADVAGRMDLAALERILQSQSVGTVVATVGTTGLGAVDPLPRILELKKAYGFRLHVDAAYGGYFRLAGNLRNSTRAAFEMLSEADSIVIDPHKHGLQPYGCGCVLFRDPRVAAIYRHESPYTYFTSDELHLGEISLECSRAGAAAVALWATLAQFPLIPRGELAAGLEAGRDAALALFRWLDRDPRFAPLMEPELDIVVWAVRDSLATRSSQRAREIFQAAAANDLHLALVTLPRRNVEPIQAIQEWDADNVVCLRSCLMKPEHREWLPQILTRLDRAANAPAEGNLRQP